VPRASTIRPGCEFTGESPCSISEGKAYIFNPKNGSLVRTLRLPREDVPGPTEDTGRRLPRVEQ
jgi:hypothetical protein